MKHIIFNEDNLRKEELTEEVTRTKILLIDNGYITVGYSNNQFQFIGGHKEKNEELFTCLKREVKEETGFNIEEDDVELFLKTEQYCKNHPSSNKNRNVIIYYYILKGSFKANLDETNYTLQEEEYNFKVKKIKLTDFEQTIKNNNYVYKNAIGIGVEMVNAFNIYSNIYEGVEIRDLYNEQRELTGLVIKKNDVVPCKMYYTTVAIFIVNSKGELLIQKRSKEKDGTYAITGGHPVSGINSLGGIIEETKEELGIKLDKEKIKLIKTIQTYNDFFDIYYIKEDVDLSKVVLQTEEVDSVCWMSIEEIKVLVSEFKFNKGHVDILKYYNDFLLTK